MKGKDQSEATMALDKRGGGGRGEGGEGGEDAGKREGEIIQRSTKGMGNCILH